LGDVKTALKLKVLKKGRVPYDEDVCQTPENEFRFFGTNGTGILVVCKIQERFKKRRQGSIL